VPATRLCRVPRLARLLGRLLPAMAVLPVLFSVSTAPSAQRPQARSLTGWGCHSPRRNSAQFSKAVVRTPALVVFCPFMRPSMVRATGRGRLCSTVMPSVLARIHNS
jgi:hypothetical protein